MTETFEQKRPRDMSWLKYREALLKGEPFSFKGKTEEEIQDIKHACDSVTIDALQGRILERLKDKENPIVNITFSEAPRSLYGQFFHVSQAYADTIREIEARTFDVLKETVRKGEASPALTAVFKTYQQEKKFLGITYERRGVPAVSSSSLFVILPSIAFAYLKTKLGEPIDQNTILTKEQLSKAGDLLRSNDFTKLVASFAALDDVVLGHLLRTRAVSKDTFSRTEDTAGETQIQEGYEFQNHTLVSDSSSTRINPEVIKQIRDDVTQGNLDLTPSKPHRTKHRGCPFIVTEVKMQYITFAVNEVLKHLQLLQSLESSNP